MSEHEHYNTDSADLMEAEDLASEATKPLGIGAFEAEDGDLDLLDGSAKKRRTGPLVLIAVVVLAVGGLFCMHTLSKITAASRGDTAIEKTIDLFLNSVTKSQAGRSSKSASELVRSHRAVVDVLSDDYTALQIPLIDVQFNPFVIQRDAQPVHQAVSDPGDDESRRLERSRAKRREEIENACNSLRLKSVIMGSVPLANLSGLIVRLGEVVPIETEGIEFRVTSITHDSITLTANEPSLKLKVDVVLELNRGR